MTQNFQYRSGKDVLAENVALEGRRVIDVGSGEGQMVRAMARLGAKVTGIECGEGQRAKAEAATKVSDERYEYGEGQAMPFPDASADVITFFNSLHHVPVPEQGNALKEAARVLIDGGTLYVAEPLAEGSMFDVVKIVDDETEVRAAAYVQLRRAAEYGFEELREITFAETRTVADVEQMHEMIVSVDPTRAANFAAAEQAFRDTFHSAGTRLPDGKYGFDLPIRVNVLRRNAR